MISKAGADVVRTITSNIKRRDFLVLNLGERPFSVINKVTVTSRGIRKQTAVLKILPTRFYLTYDECIVWPVE